MNFKQVGYAMKSVVITVGPNDGGANPSPDNFEAADSGHAPGHLHEIDLQIPAGSRLFAAWYTPMDRINALTNFALIDVRIKSNTDVVLELSAVPNVSSFLRIQIHALYGVSA